jgi:TonB family protein
MIRVVGLILRRRFFVIRATAALVTLSVVASAQYDKKPYIEWSEKEAAKIMNDSPWSQTHTLVDTSKAFNISRVLSPHFDTREHLVLKPIGLALLALLFLNSANSLACQRDEQPQTPSTSDVTEITRLNQQVVILVDQGKLDEALSLGKQVLNTAEKRLGSGHTLAGRAAYNLATVYFAKKQYYDAAKFYQKCLSIYERALGPNDPKLADVLFGLGWSSYAIGEVEKTESCLLRSLSISEKANGPGSTETAESLYVLGQFYQKSGKGNKAVEFYKRAIPIFEKTRGENDQELGELLEKCSCALVQTGQKQEAATMGLRSQVILHKRSPDSVLGHVLQGKAVFREEPVYPAAAKHERISGTVIVEVTVDETGKVIATRAICGPDLLVPASLEAARNWRFTPTTLGGQAVKVIGTITFNFHL